MPSINSNTGALFSVNANNKAEREMAASMKRLSLVIGLLMLEMMLQVPRFPTECSHK